ncbi:transcription factor ORG2-like [Rutidosis leptorrhynchoides]|uniref:transcription factor ORG2-like n=1 Tax=Rutidosis leptorrhynchoides TaxID=125765 RepID=UPI003A993437
MLALSPTLFSYGWLNEDLITQNIQQDYTNDHISLEFEANSYHSLLNLPTNDQIIEHDIAQENSISISSAGTVNQNIGDPVKVAKKLNHNASERERRKKVNDLYAFLRSLLPISNDQKKKLSIPRTVSRALKYIAELQKEVGMLIRKKEKLLSYSSSAAQVNLKKQSPKDAILKRKSSVVSSVSVLSEKEVMIQLISSTDFTTHNNEIGPLSKVLEYLEPEEDGYVLLNSTTFKSSGEGIISNTLHLKVQGDKKIEADLLKEKLCSFHRELDEIFI